MKRHLILVWAASCAAAYLFAAGARADCVVSASCSQDDVQASIDSASDGDIVIVPEETCTWTSVVRIDSKQIALWGAGMDRTVIVDEVSRDTSEVDDCPLIIESAADKPVRVTGFTFQGGAEDTNDYHGVIRVGGTGEALRIDHVKFDHLYTLNLELRGDVRGIVDHCEFVTGNWVEMVYLEHNAWGGQSYGDGSWSSPLSLGTGQALYLEDNVFTWDGGPTAQAALDCCGGGRFVFRYNQINNTSIGNHGTESTGRARSCFSYEIYENTFTRTDTPSHWTLFFDRGGTGVIFNNTADENYDTLAHANNYRDFHDFDPWGACDGTSPYDVTDGVVHDSGTHTGGDGEAVLTCSGKSWTADQWVGYSLHNTTTGKSCIITGNTADTVSAKEDPYADSLSWNAGDGFEIRQAYPCIDQVGRSAGNAVSGDDPPMPQAWPEQALEPLYEWDNTVGGEDGDIVSDSPHLVEGRDFFNDTPRPDYVPFTYPHPLTVDSCADLGGTCCASDAACEGGVMTEAVDCGELCCLCGTCSEVMETVEVLDRADQPDAVSEDVPEVSDAADGADAAGDPAEEEGDRDSGGCGCRLAQ
jgi:hypothetical protein